LFWRSRLLLWEDVKIQMIKQADKALAQELVRRGFLTQQSADKYLAEIESSTESLQEILVRNGYVPEKQVMGAVAAVAQLELVDLKPLSIEPAAIKKVPVRFAWYFKFMPIKLEGKTLTIASSTPLDVKLQDEIRVHLGVEPKMVLARESEVIDALNRYYGLAADTVDRLVKGTEKQPEAQPDYSS
jgi:hypothetical protein